MSSTATCKCVAGSMYVCRCTPSAQSAAWPRCIGVVNRSVCRVCVYVCMCVCVYAHDVCVWLDGGSVYTVHVQMTTYSSAYSKEGLSPNTPWTIAGHMLQLAVYALYISIHGTALRWHCVVLPHCLNLLLPVDPPCTLPVLLRTFLSAHMLCWSEEQECTRRMPLGSGRWTSTM